MRALLIGKIQKSHKIEEKSNIKEIPGEYYFESDHEALRNNPDYLSLMKTYALLQAKKIQAVKDIEDLISARTAALSQDPRRFLTKFQGGQIEIYRYLYLIYLTSHNHSYLTFCPLSISVA